MGIDDSASQEQILNARKYTFFQKYKNLIIIGSILISLTSFISLIFE